MNSTQTQAQNATSGGRPLFGLKYAADIRQVGILSVYMGLLASMFFFPIFRNPVVLVLACYFSFLNAVIIHNSLHQAPFHSSALNSFWKMLLSFGNLYPASANMPSHNLVHHHFHDDGQPDWADPYHVRFRWNLLNLLHFPNVAGPNTFEGVSRWMGRVGKEAIRRQYLAEQAFAFGLTGLLLFWDLWGTLFFIVVPQLWGARGILRINHIQHDGAEIQDRWNHSRNFVGRAFNWIMCNNGYHTIHHNRPGLHWSVLPEHHEKEVVPQIRPELNERSMVMYLLRAYVFNFRWLPQRSSIWLSREAYTAHDKPINAKPLARSDASATSVDTFSKPATDDAPLSPPVS
ncbi:MAG: fatty acid desaturase [Myxococcales bacterium]|nr:fatty acid desaturase [Myxococcales bacterium]